MIDITNSKLRKNVALLVIGDEILNGQTKDKNIATIADFCTKKGVDLQEVRIVLDEEKEIIAAINALRSRYSYVFSTGGIGPTHDDITAAAMAKAFGVELIMSEQAKLMMQKHSKVDFLSAGRERMARIPSGANLISNSVTGAPGFQMGNVYVLAGVPVIMQAMLDEIAISFVKGEKINSKEITVGVGESKIAFALGEIQNSFKTVKIGSYPQMGKFSCVVLRSIDKIALEQAAKLVQTMVDKIHKDNDITLPTSKT